MLPTEHDTTAYAKPTFRRHAPERRSFRQVLARVLAIKEVGVHAASIDLNDSECAGLEAFSSQFEATRHELMLRKVRGEPMSNLEELVLRVLNAELEAHLPLPEPRPADVTAAVQEAKRILGQLEDASP